MTEPGAQGKLLGARAMKLRISVAAVLLLAAGAALAPRPPGAGEAARLAPSEERSAPLLEEQVRRRAETRPALDIPEAAARARPQVVAIPIAQASRISVVTDYAPRDAAARAGGVGARVSATHVITHAAALDGRSTVALATSDGGQVQGTLVAYDRATGLALLQTPPSAAAPASLAPAPAPAGTLAIHVGVAAGVDEAGLVSLAGRDGEWYDVGAAAGTLRPGTPIFALDGPLLAVAGEGGRVAAIGGPAARLFAIAQSGVRTSAFGLAFQALDGSLAAVFGGRGVLVADVVSGGPAAVAGIEPGDVLLAVDEGEVDGIEAAAAALDRVARGSTASFRLRRAGQERIVQAAGSSAFGVAALARHASDVPEGAPPAAALVPPARLLQAGVPESARVLAVNGRAVASAAEARRAIGRARGPVTLRIAENGRRYFVAIEAVR
jgi:S1-C subfamily serine protease